MVANFGLCAALESIRAPETFESRLHQIRKEEIPNDLPDMLRERIDQRITEMLDTITKETGEFLHNLDIDEHSEDEVRAAIQAFPSALSYVSYVDEQKINRGVPIQSAVMYPRSTPFVPLLAEEGNFS